MIYLILAVTSSMLVSVIMRVSEKYIHNNITMLASNYLMCSVLAAICTGTWNLFPVSAEGFSFSVGLGLISGLCSIWAVSCCCNGTSRPTALCSLRCS